MRLTYIYHSGFAIEGENFTIIIDYYRDSDGENDGIVHDSLLHRAGKLYVLSTHSHSDHFNPKIFDLAATHPNIHYVLSDDIWQNKVPEHLHGLTWFVDPGKIREFKEGGGIRITAFKSTDEGVAFVVETGIFSPGTNSSTDSGLGPKIALTNQGS